ncbi:MAG TPA: pyridoxamine 5'-phosphate oxidase [Micavibrio sp.]|nr:pyridoxamine 5'-phosphate oxidase [Micavibrio sp.]
MSADIIKSLEKAEDAPANPYQLFDIWMADATVSEPNDPNAMSLATIDAKGRPAVRMVLLKGLDERGFIFYTNQNSYKGQSLAANPQAALCFHWKTLGRSVRVQGSIEVVTDEEADAYYNTRGRGSRIGAWASLQSQELDSRTTLAQRVKDLEEKFKDVEDIPRPPHWSGYRVKPDTIEFWHDGEHRLHTRVVYPPAADGTWSKVMKYP